MLEGLVQNDHPLTLQHVLDRMRRVTGRSQVVTLRSAEGDTTRASYAEVAERAGRLASGLQKLGVEPEDRVATFQWNSQEHLEVYMAAPCMGAVLHTLNLRLFPDQLTYIVGHAADKVIVVDASLIPLLGKVADRLDGVEHFIVVGDGDTSPLGDRVIAYEKVLGDADFDWPEIDDRQAAGLCYTSGTTGDPKGVLYSHRSNILHAICACTADAMGLRSGDRALPIVPMFHVNAWGMPYAAALVGADLIMPGAFLQPEPLAKLIEAEKVTVTGAVPTIFQGLLGYVDEHDTDLSSIRTVVCGGAAVPRSLMEAFQDRHGVEVVQAWGMTETSPLGAFARPPRQGMEESEAWEYRSRTGRVVPLVEARITTDEGEELPWDGATTGELEVRGPWIAREYFEADAPDKFRDGWLRTGDIAAIDDQGFIQITDRTKDVIKSGGEWISSVELENELMAHDAVAEAAVVAMPDDKWSERPLACVVRKDGQEVSADDLREHLVPRVAKWWLPESFAFIDEVPKTSTAKFDKKVLRQRLKDGELELEQAGEPAKG